MRQYETYKNSEAQWVGKVPSNWKRTRIKFLLSRSSAGVWGDDEKGDANDIACFRVADFDYEHGCLSFDKLTYRNIEPKQLQGRMLSLGDLLIEKSGGGDATPVGRVVRYNYADNATCSNFVHSVSINNNCLSDYLYYYFFAMYANKENLLYFNQTTGIQNLKIGDYLSQTIFLPPLSEQREISSYLDKKCAEIHKAIATQQKRIELLQELRQNIITHAVTRGINPDAPLKDSGVKWIGMVPEHWEICAFKRKIVINNGRDYKEFLDSEIYPVMGSGGCFAYCSKYMYDGEAVLLGRKGTIDKPLYINGKFWAVDTMFYAVPKKDLNCKFAYYLALTFPFNYYSTSTALPSMTQSDLGNNPVAFPPLEEQHSIVTYIEAETAKLDKQIAKANRQISLLQELKQSIITEVVTGNRKVC